MSVASGVGRAIKATIKTPAKAVAALVSANDGSAAMGAGLSDGLSTPRPDRQWNREKENYGGGRGGAGATATPVAAQQHPSSGSPTWEH